MHNIFHGHKEMSLNSNTGCTRKGKPRKVTVITRRIGKKGLAVEY